MPKSARVLSIVAALWVGGAAPMIAATEERSTHQADIEAAKNVGIAASSGAGALIGAGAGMPLGPVGATVGGVVGATAGAIMAIEGNRRFDQAIENHRSGEDLRLVAAR